MIFIYKDELHETPSINAEDYLACLSPGRIDTSIPFPH